jgi:hypothetical protein
VIVPLVCAVLATMLLPGSTSLAQDRTAELSVGVGYPLLSQELRMEEDSAWNVQLSYLASPRFSVGFVYERLESIDTLDQSDPGSGQLVNGDATLILYGLSGLFVLSGDPEFEVFALLSMGRGSIRFDNPLPLQDGLRNETDVDLWYEVGGGARFALGERWNLRMQVTYRRISPHQPSLLLEQSESAVVPSLFLGLRF